MTLPKITKTAAFLTFCVGKELPKRADVAPPSPNTTANALKYSTCTAYEIARDTGATKQAAPRGTACGYREAVIFKEAISERELTHTHPQLRELADRRSACRESPKNTELLHPTVSPVLEQSVDDRARWLPAERREGLGPPTWQSAPPNSFVQCSRLLYSSPGRSGYLIYALVSMPFAFRHDVVALSYACWPATRFPTGLAR